jgi:uncharacterized protein (TIGR02996 family)
LATKGRRQFSFGFGQRRRMGDDTTFLTAIRANPGDDTVRLVYADWLEEQGDARGGFLRAECALSATAPTDSQRAELQARLRDAGAGADPRWVATVSRAPIENCPAECQSGCPQRWERLSPVRSEAARGCDQCGQEVVFCCSIGMAQARAALGHRFAIDPRLARTPRDLESNPDDVARLIHTAAYDTSREDTSEFGTGKFEYVNADEAIDRLRGIFARGFTEAGATLIRLHAPDAPVMGAALLRRLVPWTLPTIEAMLDDPLPRARLAAASALTWDSSYRDSDARQAAVEAAGKPEGRIPGIWSRLLRLLDDEHPGVRSAAVFVIGRSPWKGNLLVGGYEALVRRLAIETDTGVRCGMFEAISRAKTGHQLTLDLEPVRGLLLSELNHKSAGIREVVAVILSLHGVRGVDVATARLDRLAIEKDPHVRRWLVCGDFTAIADRALPALSSVVRSDPNRETRNAAIMRLADFGPAAAPALLAALDDPDGGVRRWAALGLQDVGDASALPRLRRALRACRNAPRPNPRDALRDSLRDRSTCRRRDSRTEAEGQYLDLAIRAIEARCPPQAKKKPGRRPGKEKPT